MALDPVPWFTGSEAKHSASTARNLAWNATGGKTGIATPTSLYVRQLSTAGNSVQIMPGGGVIESIYQGALQQSYTVRNAEAETVKVPANAESSTKTYYITVEVVDPTYAGPKPPSTEDGPYNFFRVRTDRQSTHPELLLAKVEVRPNSVVTDADITDLRTLANPRREELIFGRPRTHADDSHQSNLRGDSSNGGEYFPGGAGVANNVHVDVPEWANRVMIEADWMAVRYAAGTNSYGSYWVEFGDEYREHTWPNSQQWQYATQRFKFNATGVSNVSQANWRLMDAKPVVSKLRGKTCNFVFKAGNSGTDEGVSMNADAGLGMKLTFVEVPDDNPHIV